MTYRDNVDNKNAWNNELSRNRREAQKVITWDYRDRDELETFWFSDAHLGHPACDEDLFRSKVDMVAEKELPCADLGDLIENSTRDSVGAGVYEQQEIAEMQMDRAIQIYRPLADAGLLKVMQTGNHEARTFNASGVNLTKMMARELGVPYGSAGVVHYIMVGNQRYVGYSTHGGSGAVTVGGKINALLKLENIIDADFYIQGHTHDTLHHARVVHQFDKRNRVIEERKRHFINNGVWMNYWGTYGQVKAYSPPNKGNAMIKFDGEKHKIQVKFE